MKGRIKDVNGDFVIEYEEDQENWYWPTITKQIAVDPNQRHIVVSQRLVNSVVSFEFSGSIAKIKV